MTKTMHFILSTIFRSHTRALLAKLLRLTVSAGGTPLQGSVSKFPGVHESLGALQHGKFDQKI